MKPINKRIAIIGLSAILVSSAGAAMAFGGPKGHHGCDRDGARAPMSALTQLDDLTSEQKDKLRDIRREARDAMRDLRDDMRDNRTDLRDAMVDNADLDTIKKLAEKQGDQVSRMIVLRAEMREKINAVLSQEQRDQLATLRENGRPFGHPRDKMRF